MFGYGPGELIGHPRSVQEAAVPENRDELLRTIAAHVERGKTWTSESHNRRKDGSTFYTQTRISGIRRADQRLWVCVQRDITAEKSAAQSLRDSEARFRLMADTAPALIWIADSAMNYVWVNRPWLEFTGREPESTRGRGWMESVHPEDRADCLEQYQRALERGAAFSVEYRLRREDGALMCRPSR